MISQMRKKKAPPEKRLEGGGWLDKKPSTGFHGYPVATVAFYGPTDKLATKIAVSIIMNEKSEPDCIERWFSNGELDIRNDVAIGEQVLAFLKTHAPTSTVVADRIIGCPHEEGTDYPEGTSCPQCPYWAGRNRFTHERVH